MNDLYKEHKFHKKFEKDCSTCFSENLRIEESYNKYAHDEAFGRTGQIDDPRWGENPLG